MKIAILILIHEFTEQQKKLIKHLSNDFDIFIHADKRSNINLNQLTELSSNIFAFKKYKVYWGHYNQIRATLFLFKTAYEHNKYNRFIFISGSDLPIKSNAYIQNFFENNNKEYLQYHVLPNPDWADNGGFDRIDYFYNKSLSRGKRIFVSAVFTKIINIILNKIVTPFMKKTGLKRNHKKITFYGGANWINLTETCVKQIIEYTDNNKWFIKRFKYTKCADEIFFQTIICNYVKNIEIEKNNLRFIDWQTGPEAPRIFRINDLERIQQSESLFARKFNATVDEEIIQKFFEMII